MDVLKINGDDDDELLFPILQLVEARKESCSVLPCQLAQQIATHQTVTSDKNQELSQLVDRC